MWNGRTLRCCAGNAACSAPAAISSLHGEPLRRVLCTSYFWWHEHWIFHKDLTHIWLSRLSVTACSDVRDRVFAVRMMMRDPKCIHVDYDLSTVDLFFELIHSSIGWSEPLIDSLVEALNLSRNDFETCRWPVWAATSLRDSLYDLWKRKTQALL
jgi:hypothetical protein